MAYIAINSRKVALVSSITLAVAIWGVNTSAYAQSDVLTDEIIVTARKKSETLATVPIAVSAYSGEVLKVLGVQEAGDIALITPNFTWNTEFGRASPQPYLRGIGTNNFAPINSGPIAVYQDGVFIGPNIAQGFATFDVERAEVLKGPQGTLYGRNSTGGLINFVSNKPIVGGGTRGDVSVELGQYGTTNFEGAIGFDLGDKAAIRFAGMRNHNTGTFTNINPAVDDDEVNSIDDWGFRGGLAIEPSDKVNMLFNVHYGLAEPDTAPFKQIGLFEPGTIADPCTDTPGFGANCGALFNGGVVDDPDIFTTGKNPDSERVETFGAFAQFDVELSDSLTLHSITSYDEADLARVDDADDTIVQLEVDFYFDEFTFFSQELRLSGQQENFNWQAGAYYYDESNEGILAFTNPIFGGGEANAHAVDTLSYAVFGNAEYELNDNWRLSGGLRWTYEEKDVQQYDVFQLTVAAEDPAILTSINDPRVLRNTIASGTTGKRDFDEITGRISLDYTFDNGNLVYASASRGFKGGDVVGAGLIFEFDLIDDARDPAAVAQLREETQIVEPEILDALEIGFKGDLIENILQLNAAAFYYDYKNQQQTTLQPDPNGGVGDIGITRLSNAARSKFPGVEAEFIFTPNDNWYFTASGGWIDAKYDEFGNPLAGGEDFSGNQTPLTARTELALLGRYRHELAGGSEVAFQLQGTHKGRTFFQSQQADTLLREGAVNLLNGRVSYTSAEGNWGVAVFGRNLTNEKYFGSGFDVSGLGYVAVKPGPRRYIGGEFTYKFGE